eukprot:7127897-Alexandrium_andersonii.AAC.1
MPHARADARMHAHTHTRTRTYARRHGGPPRTHRHAGARTDAGTETWGHGGTGARRHESAEARNRGCVD